jgi:hypothetical protein
VIASIVAWIWLVGMLGSKTTTFGPKSGGPGGGGGPAAAAPIPTTSTAAAIVVAASDARLARRTAGDGRA